MRERLMQFFGGVVLAVCGTIITHKAISTVFSLATSGESDLAAVVLLIACIVGGLSYCLAYTLLRGQKE